ncbi:MAG: hypothetical protein H7X93_06415, partial [Sphingomonadaceae bacterium]|nr:hypothetical protein [Sphingomonadaceae bacterium]
MKARTFLMTSAIALAAVPLASASLAQDTEQTADPVPTPTTEASPVEPAPE